MFEQSTKASNVGVLASTKMNVDTISVVRRQSTYKSVKLFVTNNYKGNAS